MMRKVLRYTRDVAGFLLAGLYLLAISWDFIVPLWGVLCHMLPPLVILVLVEVIFYYAVER